MAIDSLLLLFTKYKTTCLTIISIHCLAASPAKKRINCRNITH